ncbi:MAG: PEP-CTERM sorting domain-containing protein [Sedimentisphaerales bacterium]
MRKLIAICAVCVCVLLTTAAWGNIVVSFDENGNGNVNNNGVITPLAYKMLNSPMIPILAYQPPLPVYPFWSGDLVVMEPGTTTISDVVRFVGAQFAVYSDNSDGVDSLADIGIPEELLSNVVYVDEVGLENGMNGVVYTPVSRQPGWPTLSGNDAVTYKFISDIPEPATICLLGLGALSLLRKRRA